MAATRSTDADKQDGTQKERRLVVKWALVQSYDKSGRGVQLYAGSPVEALDDAEIDRLIGMEAIGEDDGTLLPGVGIDPNKSDS